MSALFTALVDSETKESLAKMVCELRDRVRELEKRIIVDDAGWYTITDDGKVALEEAQRRYERDAT
jgi:hypothetical protein